MIWPFFLCFFLSPSSKHRQDLHLRHDLHHRGAITMVVHQLLQLQLMLLLANKVKQLHGDSMTRRSHKIIDNHMAPAGCRTRRHASREILQT